jgi:hypothetical protein
MERSSAEQRVLDTFFDGDRLVLMPTRRAKRLVVLDQVAQLFELGRTYGEHEVNALLTLFIPMCRPCAGTWSTSSSCPARPASR